LSAKFSPRPTARFPVPGAACCLLLLLLSPSSFAVPLAAQAASPAVPAASPAAQTAHRRQSPDLLGRDRQIAALRAQNQLIAIEKLQQQLVQEQRNQQFQFEAMTRRSQLQNALSGLLFLCLLLTVALAWSLWRVNLARRNQALEDPLTGLKNRRFLIPFMEHETGRLRRSSLSALILIADIDHFKSVNDRWGHGVGDKALLQVANILRSCVRNSDIVARWGGEEFVLICPQSSQQHVEVICGRIRHHLQQTPVQVPGKATFHLTVSIGAALFSPATADENWMAALARADRSLYGVKQNGRDGWLLDTADSLPSAHADPVHA
jgi:diguanylate cyclase (GGDEF)-like protein